LQTGFICRFPFPFRLPVGHTFPVKAH
jgi:hypothetical protein